MLKKQEEMGWLLFPLIPVLKKQKQGDRDNGEALFQ